MCFNIKEVCVKKYNKIKEMDYLSKNKLIIKIFILLNIYFMWLEIAMPRLMEKLTFNRLFFILVVISFATYLFLYKCKSNRKLYIKYNNRILNIFIMLVLYILFDLIGIVYSPITDISFFRYSLIFSMLVFLLIVYIIFDTKKDIKLIFFTIGISSLTICIATLINYFILNGVSTSYRGGITMVPDYNVYTSQIIIGISFLLISIVRLQNSIAKNTAYLFISIISITTLILSGSRRGIIFLVIISITLIYDYFFNVRKKSNILSKLNVKKIIVIIIGVFLIGSLITFTYYFVSNQNNDLIISNKYKTILSEKLFTSRLVRWTFTLNEFKEFSISSKLIGKGTGYDKFIFFNKYGASTLGSDYPHNMLLTDLLNGGIVKVSILVLLWVQILKILLTQYKIKDKMFFMNLIIMCIIIGFNNFISYGGIIYNKPFWIFLGLLLLVYKNGIECSKKLF